MAVPLYWGQPGTSVLGGARPPPQSRMSQSSPVPGTYPGNSQYEGKVAKGDRAISQAREAPAGEETSVEVQPLRSVFARASAARVAGRTKKVKEGIMAVAITVRKSGAGS